MKISNFIEPNIRRNCGIRNKVRVSVEFIKVLLKGTEILVDRKIQFNSTIKKKLSEVAANENTLYRATAPTAGLKADTVDVSERFSTNSKKIE